MGINYKTWKEKEMGLNQDVDNFTWPWNIPVVLMGVGVQMIIVNVIIPSQANLRVELNQLDTSLFELVLWKRFSKDICKLLVRGHVSNINGL